LLAGARASRIAARQALVDRQRCGLVATHAWAAPPLPPQARLEGDTGQGPADRSCRCRTAPRGLAASRELNKPARRRARLMVMTVGWLVDAALASRLRTALTAHRATVPHQPGPPGQRPTARGVFPDGVGMHGRLIPGPWPLVRHLTEEPQQRLTRLGNPSERGDR
jgi:hypothetical protein